MGCENSTPAVDKKTTASGGATATMAGKMDTNKATEKPFTNMSLPEPQADEYRELAWAIPTAGAKLKPMYVPRTKVTTGQVRIEILFTGVNRVDLNLAKNRFGGQVYPFVPGSEVVGVVKEVDAAVKKFKVGDFIGVGCIVDSCLKCQFCKAGDEQLCANHFVATAGGKKRHGRVGGNLDL